MTGGIHAKRTLSKIALDPVGSSMRPSCMSKFWPKVILCVVIVMVLGAAGGFVTAGSIPDWYAKLAKPPGTPPNAVFGPVWSVLYLMIGISLARVWHFAPVGPEKRRALIRFAIQMISESDLDAPLLRRASRVRRPRGDRRALGDDPSDDPRLQTARPHRRLAARALPSCG
jgi:hypothetical protein